MAITTSAHSKQLQMNLLNLVADEYERKARIYPALIVIAPGILVAVAALISDFSSLKAFAAAIGSCGGTFSLSQLARDAGKKKEKALFEQWGGMPSISIFRHRDNRLDPVTKGRYHAKLSHLVKGTKAISAKEEQSNPNKADKIYEAWSHYIRVNTRDTKKYRMIFQENINYGFRRNIWGMRLIGGGISFICIMFSLYLSYEQYNINRSLNVNLNISAIICAIFLMLWIFRFSSEWVRIPANAYSERLAEAVETINPARSDKY